MSSENRIKYDTTYRFFLEIDGVASPLRVKEVSGLKMSTRVTRVQEGGNNGFEVAMIDGQTYDPLTLKKGYVASDESLYGWMADLHGSGKHKRKTIRLIVLGDGTGSGSADAIGTYEIYGAFVSDYEGPSFDAQGKDVGYETLKIHYDYFTYSKS